MYCGRDCQKSHWLVHRKVCVVAKNQPVSATSSSTVSKFDASRLPTVNLGDFLKALNLDLSSVSSSDPSQAITGPLDLNRPTQKEAIGDFSQDDLATLRYSKREIDEINKRFAAVWNGQTLCKSTMACFDYTLLKVGERGVREQLFTPIGDQLNKVVITERLGRWGYEITEAPKKGDLVLYFDEKDLTHMALYLGDGRALSKPGNEVSYEVTHPVDEACNSCGSRVIYYRKNPLATPVYKEDNVIKFKYV